MARARVYKAIIATALASAAIYYAYDAPSTDVKLSSTEYFLGGSIEVKNPKLARQNWMLECQGCHKADASGKGDEMPNMNGEVSKLLSVPGGREYIYRVNGITHSPLSDEDLVDLMNWMIVEFDPEHIPDGFSGFKIEEVRRLRGTPHDHKIVAKREALARAIKNMESGKRFSQP